MIGLGLNRNLNKLNKYFGINLPLWMDSRKTLFVFSSLDFIFIFLFLRNISSHNNEILNLNRCISFSLIWGLLSYISGRYSFFIRSNSKTKKLYKLLVSTILVTLVSYTLDKALIVFFNKWVPLGRDNGTFILIFSFIIQSFKFLYNKSVKNCQYLYLVGSNDKKVKNFIKNANSVINSKNLIIRKFKDYKNISTEFSTFVILDNKYENFLEKYSHLISKQTEIITASNWCEKNLQRIPSEYLSENDFDFNNLINQSQNINWRIKRFGDITISLFLLLISSPLILFFALLIKIEDNGKIFYSQVRTGLYGKTFKMYKLRSMRPNSEINGPVWAIKKDPRITKVGNILRKSRIDELPQLWSVVLGDMSLIGPRPERPEIDKLLIKEIPFYNYRNTIKPGISGWAQVNYRYGASVEDSDLKFSYEIFYLKNYSLLFDILIFMKTLKLVINMEGSSPK